MQCTGLACHMCRMCYSTSQNPNSCEWFILMTVYPHTSKQTCEHNRFRYTHNVINIQNVSVCSTSAQTTDLYILFY